MSRVCKKECTSIVSPDRIKGFKTLDNQKILKANVDLTFRYSQHFLKVEKAQIQIVAEVGFNLQRINYSLPAHNWRVDYGDIPKMESIPKKFLIRVDEIIFKGYSEANNNHQLKISIHE